jgi:hypothetical protein
MLGRSLAAQRGCWKLFHETPTVQPVVVAPEPLGVPLEQAAAMTATIATISATRR